MKKTLLVPTFSAIALITLTLTFPTYRANAQKNKQLRITPVRPTREVFVPNRVLVKFRSNIELDNARQIIAALGARDAGTLPQLGVFVLDLPEEADEAAFANVLQHRPDVEFAELDRILAPAGLVPNDPWYPNETHLTKIAASSAWEITTGSSNVIIAILDTGVEATHPDLAPNLVPGWNTYDNNSDTTPVTNHGTTVAGTAAAATNNGSGLAAIGWSSKIMPVRVCDAAGYGSYSAIANGLTWAANHGARVANISYIVSGSSTVSSAAQYFQNKGGVVTSSAGNYGTFDSSSDNSYVLTVGATDWNDVLYSWSNTGNNIDLVAPGLVFTTFTGGTYNFASGTSFSAPLVAGVAALVISANPNLTGVQVRDILKQSADDLGSVGWDPLYGCGRLNAGRAVTLATNASLTQDTQPPTVSIISPTNGSFIAGTVSISVSASDNIGVTSLVLSIDGVQVSVANNSSLSILYNTNSIFNGSHSINATATDAAGNRSSVSSLVNVNNPIDTIPPTVSISSPNNGAKVPTNLSVYASSSDNIAVIKVELYVDGLLQSASTTSPFTTKWNTSKAARGSHLLRLRAYDAAGNWADSLTCQVFK